MVYGTLVLVGISAVKILNDQGELIPFPMIFILVY